MIRAIAIASECSDVVGTVDLDCTRDGLSLTFVRAAPYAVSFAPSAPLVGRRALVPYDRIERIWDDGETLRIVMDAPRVPYKRLVLAHFSHDRAKDHRDLLQKRWRGHAAVAGLAALLAAAAVPLAALASPLLGSLLGAVAVFGVVALSLNVAPDLVRAVQPLPPDAGADRRALFDELREHLPLHAWEDFAPPPEERRAAAGRSLAPASGRSAEHVSASPNEEEAFPFSGRAVGVLVGASALGLLLLSASLRLIAPIESGAVPSSGETQTPGRPPSALPAAAVTATDPRAGEIPSGESCLCQTPSSAVIPVRVPRLTALAEVTRARIDARRPSLELQVAVVNNAALPTGEIKATLGFLHAASPGETPRKVQTRGVFYEGPLAAGGAIKWRVRGRGSSFAIDGLDDSPVADESLASPDAFAKLLGARARSVQLHGAAMLARARDERAGPAIERLRAGARDDEAAFLTSIARAAAPVYACKLAVVADTEGRVSVTACVMNTTVEDVIGLEVTLALAPGGARTPVSRGESPPPLLRSTIARNLRVPAKTGVIVRGSADVSDITQEVVGELELGPALSP